MSIERVADPTAPIELRTGVFVDATRELLAQKLCVLRDLEDIGALLDAGGDLGRVLDAASKDGGFRLLPSHGFLLRFRSSGRWKKDEIRAGSPPSEIDCS